MRLTYENGKFRLTGVPAKTREKLKSSQYRIDRVRDGSYSFTHLGAAAKYREFATGKTKRLLKKVFQEHYKISKLPPLPELDSHQRRGVNWILTRKRSYLAHAPGAGKTITTIVASCLASSRSTLIICPPSLTGNWRREIKIWAKPYLPHVEVSVVSSSAEKNEVDWDADFVIVPDSMLAKSWVAEKLREILWNFIGVDEASRLKEITSQRSLAFYGGQNEKVRFSPLFRKARHVVFLDGSPMPNRPMELWAPATALHPESIDCRSYDEFGYRYCGAKPNEMGKWEYLYSSHEEELRQKLQKDFMYVVTEEELDHPERRRKIIVLSKDVRTTDQKEWEAKNLNEIFENTLSEDLSKGEIASYRREMGIAKIPLIVQYVRERLEKGERILLFCWHREVATQIAFRLGSKVLTKIIIGGASRKAVDQAIRSFQEGETQLLVLNIAAAERGHNLQRADRAIFGEYSWSNETNKQCEKRISRKGNTKAFVPCDYLVAPNSMDERILRSVFTKEKRVRKVIG